MNTDTVVLTYSYGHFWGTDHFFKSCERVGLPVHEVKLQPSQAHNHGLIIRKLYDAIIQLKNVYKYLIYADCADSIFVRAFKPKDGIITWSAERAVWPPTPDLSNQYPVTDSPYKYINGGGWMGETELLIKYFETYKLHTHENEEVNGQYLWATAYLQALKDGFPIELDTQAEYFQTMAFEDPSFPMYEMAGKINGVGSIINNITKNQPSLIHGNGRVNIQWVYDFLNN